MAWESLDWYKFGFVILAFLEAFGMGMIPVKFKSFSESPKVLGIANAFSGGIFIAISLIHIMPEQADNYDQWKEKQPGEYSDFPYPFLLMLSGYTLILIIDKVVFDTHAVFGDHSHDGEDDHLHKSMVGGRT